MMELADAVSMVGFPIILDSDVPCECECTGYPESLIDDIKADLPIEQRIKLSRDSIKAVTDSLLKLLDLRGIQKADE
jgi:hypothetical protein